MKHTVWKVVGTTPGTWHKVDIWEERDCWKGCTGRMKFCNSLWWGPLFRQPHFIQPRRRPNTASREDLYYSSDPTSLPLLLSSSHTHLFKLHRTASASASSEPRRRQDGNKRMEELQKATSDDVSNLTLHISSAAALHPEEVILLWNTCLTPDHWLDASSCILLAIYASLGGSQSLICLNPHLGEYLLPFCAPSRLLSCLFIPVCPKS